MATGLRLRLVYIFLGVAAAASVLQHFVLFWFLASARFATSYLLVAVLVSGAISTLLLLASGVGLTWLAYAVFKQLSGGMAQVRGGAYSRLVVSRSNPFGECVREFNRLVEELRNRDEKLRLWAQQREAELARTSRLLGLSRDHPGALEAKVEGLVAADSRNSTVAVDKLAAELVGLPAESIIGAPLEEVIARLRTRTTDQRSLDEGCALLRAGAVDEVRLELDGTTPAARVRIARVLETPNRPLAPGRNAAAPEGNQLERMKSEFMSIVSHELRTPLTSIKGALSLIRGGASGHVTSEARELLDIAVYNTERMVTLVNNVLDIVQLEHGGIKFQLGPTFLQDVVEEALRCVNSQAAARNVQLHVALPEPSPLLSIDAQRIVQVLVNLLLNAIKFSPEGSRVLISGTAHDEFLEVSVQDFGVGMNAEFMSRLFHKFEQEEEALTRATQGCGLGLVICKLIVEAHGGRIWAESTENVGSTFYFTLPVAGKPSSVPTILIVDEDDDVATALGSFCAEQGLRLVPCHNPKDAVRLARHYRPKLVALDRVGDGHELCHQLAHDSVTQNIPIVCFAPEDELENAGTAGFHYAAKPVDLLAFRALLTQYALV